MRHLEDRDEPDMSSKEKVLGVRRASLPPIKKVRNSHHLDSFILLSKLSSFDCDLRQNKVQSQMACLQRIPHVAGQRPCRGLIHRYLSRARGEPGSLASQWPEARGVVALASFRIVSGDEQQPGHGEGHEPLHFVLYTREECPLCQGLEEKLQVCVCAQRDLACSKRRLTAYLTRRRR